MNQLLDLDKFAYKVQMIRHNAQDGHADFIFKVLAPNGVSFHIMDRYSSMRQFQSLLKKDLDDSVNLNNLPQFPKKRYVGGLDPKFLDDRMMQLGMFFNAFLSIPQVAKSKLVLTYFASKAADQES